MLVSEKIIESLRKRPESDSWALGDALRGVVNALFNLEKDEHDPDVLRELAKASIEASKDLQAVLGVLSEIVED